MADIIELTGRLITKGLAYQVDGDVYFDVAQYPEYGRLSKRHLEDLQAGARVDVDERKRHPMDFALWKSAKPGEPAWESPWGPGRPGWHIECSAMSIRHLGETFDIHGGGMDLIFPHHENEIAQSCGATGKEFARYWIHNGFVQINKEKMSKSLGNFFTIREIFEKSEWSEAVTGEVLRYFLLSTHYHGPLDFSDYAIKEAKNALNGFYDLFRRLAETGGNEQVDQGLSEAVDRCRAAFKSSMDDDFNTPMAIAALQGLRSDVNKLLGHSLSTEGRRRAREEFRSLGNNLGLFPLDLDMKWQFKGEIFGSGALHAQAETGTGTSAVLTSGTGVAQLSGETPTVKESLGDASIEAKIAERAEAKKKKDFKRADAIRAELHSQGIIIEDKPDGTSRWKR
jgi:cysteinyl-tRNA synthetase